MGENSIRLQIRLLGRFEAQRDGVVLSERDLGSLKGRTLLKLLLLERGRIAASDRIAEALWPGQPPARHERIVATLVSRLRSVLGTDAIEGGPGGYRISTNHFEIDLDSAERLTDESEALLVSEPVLARAAAQGALEVLSRGEVLEDEPYAEWAEPLRAETRTLTRRARRAVWLAGAALGDFEAAARVAEAALVDDPLDEEACRAVMTAHASSGRPGEALRCYELLRAALAEQIGVDPAPETRALHLAVLREEELPELASVGIPVAPPSFDPGFIGREHELHRLKDLWSRAASGRPTLVLLTGESGIGKTQLAGQIALLARKSGGLVVQTRCHEAEHSLFLQPIADAVRSLAVSVDPDRLREVSGDGAGTLARLVPEVGVILRPHTYRSSTPDVERRRSFEAVTSFFRAFARRQPVLLFLDDLHNAGSSTLELLHYMLRRAPGAALLVLATVRIEEGNDALTQLREVATRLDIGPLDHAAVKRIAATAGAEELTERILQRTGGHPLFVVETLRSLVDGTGEEAIPESLMSAVVTRVERIGSEVEEFLRAVAVLGSNFELSAAAEMIDVPVHDAARRAERALIARLLSATEDSFEFANDLIKEILYVTTPPPIRLVRHRRAAELMRGRPESVAVHAAAAADWPAAAQAWIGAGVQAFERQANRDAERMLELALDAANKADDGVAEATAHLLRGRVREALIDYEGALIDQQFALELARETGQRRIEMQALRELGGDILLGVGQPTAECIPHLLGALDLASELEDGVVEVGVLSRLAVISTNKLQLEDAYRFARLGVQRAREVDDEPTLALALDGLKTVSAYAGNLTILRGTLGELDSLVRRHGMVLHLQWTIFESSFVPFAVGDWGAAIARLKKAMDLNRRTGYAAFEAMFVAQLGWVFRSMGRYEDALSHGLKATELASEVGHPWWTAFAGTMLGWTLTELGRPDEAIGHLETALKIAERDGSESYLVRCLSHLALAFALCDRRDDAFELLPRADIIFESVTAPPGEAVLHGAHAYFAAARARLELGDRDRALNLVDAVREPAAIAGWVEIACEADLLTGQILGDETMVKNALGHADRQGLARLQQLGNQVRSAGGTI
jgi:DNA-binding SARP family transcriptional activator/tetratricopeptide (TPR) repeat protein